MTQRLFYVTARWDDEAKVYVSERDITGLHIEAETLEEFEREVFGHALELVLENHVSPADLASKPFAELVPGIVFGAPADTGLAHAG